MTQRSQKVNRKSLKKAQVRSLKGEILVLSLIVRYFNHRICSIADLRHACVKFLCDLV